MNERRTPPIFHPANAPVHSAITMGHGRFARQFVGETMVVDRTDGIETIQNDSSN